MKKNGELVRLVHNPNAGDGQQYTKKGLIALIEAHGYACVYSSSQNKALKAIEPETKFIAIAGGDGTIRATIMNLLKKKVKHKRPIALLPFGTANNIAKSLRIPEDATQNVASWAKLNLKKLDVGQLTGIGKTAYFIESLGFGLFPKLMKELSKKNKDHIQTAADEFEMALNELLELSKNYKAVPFRIEINDQVIEEECIMVEVMNISTIGPQLNLSKDADPGDGHFDVVIVTAKQRTLLERYITQKRDHKQPDFPIKPIRAKNMVIYWEGKDVHIDDEIVDHSKTAILKISLLDNLLEIVTRYKL